MNKKDDYIIEWLKQDCEYKKSLEKNGKLYCNVCLTWKPESIGFGCGILGTICNDCNMIMLKEVNNENKN